MPAATVGYGVLCSEALFRALLNMKYCERYAKILRFHERKKRPNNWSQKGFTIKVEPIR